MFSVTSVKRLFFVPLLPKKNKYVRIWIFQSLVGFQYFYFNITFLKNGAEHRVNGPAEIVCYHNGSKLREAWLVNGKLHREGGFPASVSYYGNGVKEFEEWFVNGKLHRKDGPASISYFENGEKMEEEWFENGKKTVVIDKI